MFQAAANVRWFSPHGTEWEAETYSEALEMERDDLAGQVMYLRSENGRLAVEAATADQDWKRAEAEANKLRHALTQVRAECELPDYIAEFIGEALQASRSVGNGWLEAFCCVCSRYVRKRCKRGL